ncbi:lysine transporter LysE [Catellatospora sp. TT07R-123]|uniref:LysE family translocator n=1 Tax=Catellatospora sp. TT07R-123 TaxID=2733863 RepID=UPI001B0926EB|nr:LysE family translocator [Catellatospora sp. TT07R-123]GHJ47038.1 lysine transporter LysE [Catellatospora sp. TT07R-123]
MGHLPLHVIAGYLAAISLLMLTPGPDMMFVIANGARYGSRAGIAAACGVAAGEAVHVAAVVAGLAGLIADSPVVFGAIRYLGAAYLIALGLHALLRTHGTGGGPQLKRPGLPAAFGRGMVTNLLNPKMILFSLAFLPQFADPGRGHLTTQLITLGGLFIAVQLIVDVSLGAGAGRLAGRLDTWQRRMQRGCAAVFIGLGVKLALS